MSESDGVSIGQAAALYGLAPSTLRWWEQQGVLPEPRRAGGRRLYTEKELRRIGLAYLCCVTGAMPLEQTSIVTAADRNRQWQNTVSRHAELLEHKIGQLRAAQRYLRHLAQCPDDDMVTNCPHLEDEIRRHTPRGRIRASSLVAAARHAPGTFADTARDENRDFCDETPTAHCMVCAGELPRPGRGRRRKYCSRACQQRNYRRSR